MKTYKHIDIEFTAVNEALPDIRENNGTPVYIHFMRNGKEAVKKGMFYKNGKKPVFASYGSTVENVIGWAYRED